MEEEKENVIEIDGLVTKFGEKVIHQNLSLTIKKGEIVAIIGGSGTGKTTLLKQILRLETPAEGSVKVLGIEVTKATDKEMAYLNSRWGMLFQPGALFTAMSVFDNVALPLRELRGLPESVIRETVLLKLKMADLSAADGEKMPAELSGGMIKRAALSRALALDPDLLFLDEPTAGLDPVRSREFVKVIQRLHKALNLTVIFVSHDVETIETLSTRIVVLHDKRVIADGTVEEIKKHTESKFIREFFMLGEGPGEGEKNEIQTAPGGAPDTGGKV